MRGKIQLVAGSQPMSTAVHKNGAQINFRDLNPYLTYGHRCFMCVDIVVLEAIVFLGFSLVSYLDFQLCRY
jgi:hypothetical protein